MTNESDRSYPLRPLVGVAGVVWDGERLVLVKRGRPPAQGSWSIPGGLIELGETPAEQALRREIREECGITVAVGPILGLFEPIERDPGERVRYHFVVIDFLSFYVSGPLQVGDDAGEARWVTPAELPRYDLLPATRSMIRQAVDIISADTGANGSARLS